MTRQEAAEILERFAIGEEGDRRDRAIQGILLDVETAGITWREARRAVQQNADWSLATLDRAAETLGLT